MIAQVAEPDAPDEFTWPELSGKFNWATDWFDTIARGNGATALWIVEEDGTERKVSFDEMASRSDQVAAWLADDSQELTRGSVKLLREFLEDKRSHEDGDRDPNTVDALTGKTDAEAGDGEQGPQDDDAKGKKEPKEADPDKLKKAIIQVKHDDRPARLILNRRPPAEGWAWLKYEDDGQEFEADLGTVQLVALLEG